MQHRIDALEGRTTATSGSEAAAATPATVEMQDLRRDDDHGGADTRVTKTQTLDISSDFDNLESSGDKEVDLTKEAKKRAKKK